MTGSARATDRPAPHGWRIAALAIGVVAAILIGLIVGYVVAPRSASDESIMPVIGEPTIVDEHRLSQIAGYVGPIYWNGPDGKSEYEVRLSSGGTVYVRYLPKGTPAGSKEEYLTVATYRSATDISAMMTGDASAQRASGANGAIIVTTGKAPLSTYFSFPKANFQVEVFSPKPGEAKSLVESGHVALVP